MTLEDMENRMSQLLNQQESIFLKVTELRDRLIGAPPPTPLTGSAIINKIDGPASQRPSLQIGSAFTHVFEDRMEAFRIEQSHIQETLAMLYDVLLTDHSNKTVPTYDGSSNARPR